MNGFVFGVVTSVLAFAGPQDDAAKTAATFIRKIGGIASAKRAISRSSSRQGQPRWEVRFDDGVLIQTTSDGRLVTFYRNSRLDAKMQQLTTNRPVLPDPRQPKAAFRAKALAKKMGLPSILRLVSSIIAPGQNHITASWTHVEHGFPFVRGNVGVTMRINPDDGRLWWYEWAPAPPIGPTMVKISASTAAATAESYATRTRMWLKMPAPAKRTVDLGWVADPKGTPATLGYRVTYGRDAVYIGAASGTVIAEDRYK